MNLEEEYLKIKEWEEKFDKEQKLMEEEEKLKDERLRQRELNEIRRKEMEEQEIKEQLSSRLTTLDLEKTRKN